MKSLRVSELTFENTHQWPLTIKYLSVALLVLLIMGVGYWTRIKPAFDAYNVLTNDQQMLKVKFEQKYQLAANLPAYKKHYAVIKDRFNRMLKQLPTQNEMAGLLDEISKTGIASGLTFELFAPMPEIQHDFYIELPVTIKVIGNYQQLALFLSRVTEMKRIVTWHDFQLSRMEQEESRQNPDELLRMEILAKIYRYQLS